MRLGMSLALLWLVHAQWSASLIPGEQRFFVQLLALAYVLCTLVLMALLWKFRKGFYWHWTLGGLLDLVVLTLMVFASNGIRTGLAPLIPVMIAGSSVPVRPRWAISLAALAALALLGVTVSRTLLLDDIDAADFSVAGVLGIACFAVAATVSWLATKLKAQEALAEARGHDLRTQLSVTRRVILELEQGVVLIDAQSQIKILNPAAQRILGHAYLGGGFDSAQLSGAWGTLRDATRRLMDGPLDQSIELSLPVATGSSRPFRIRLLRIEDTERLQHRGGASELFDEAPDDGKADTLILIEDVQSLQERAQQLKLAAMGRLSASIAHEIRNPLGAIRHANSLLSEQVQGQLASAQPAAGSVVGPQIKQQARLAKIIEDNTVRINTIVEDVLAIARRDRAQIEPIVLQSFLPAMIEEHLAYQQIDPSRVVVLLEADEPISFDSGHLRQVLTNLLDNALRYAPVQPKSVQIEWARNASGRLQLSVADAGSGIEAAEIEHVFEPFYTTHSQGTGLGLFLVREWCLANNAQIQYLRLPEASIYSGAFMIEPEQI
jgi:two-component system, NtrC family, sensor histidine kinase PilS